MRIMQSGLALLVLLAGCGSEEPVVTAEPELETIVVSRWTEKTELFMEYDPLARGVTRRFAIHFTNLADFTPLEQGTVTVSLQKAGEPAETFTADAPSRPGIFGVDVTPAASGDYSMTVLLDAPGVEDVHELGPVNVYPSEDVIPAADPAPEVEQISFLKEQQWTLDFATQLAGTRRLRESLVVTGEVRPRSGGEVEVTAPIAGRLAATASLPVVGTPVTEGEALASLIPLTPAPADRPSLELSISEAKTNLDLARQELARVERLLEAGAIPARRVQEAQAAQVTAEARLKAAEDRLSQYETSRQADGTPGEGSSFTVRAPISGVIAEVGSPPGANVRQGDRLFRIFALDRVYVAAHVPEAETGRLAQLTGARIVAPGLPEPLSAGRVVAKASVVDPQSRTLSVLFEIRNPARTLAIGQAVSVNLLLSGLVEAVAVPEEAIIDDGGRPVVFVQVGGESFERRPVKLGIRDSGAVQIVNGASAGDRVVTRGGHLIRLAALSTQVPAHGHVH